MDANVAEVQLVMALAEAKSRQSIEDALAIYHPDGVLECPPWGTVSRGDELRGALEAFFWLAPDYEAQLDGMAADRGDVDVVRVGVDRVHTDRVVPWRPA